jgi:hypothetical protein
MPNKEKEPTGKYTDLEPRLNAAFQKYEEVRGFL